MGLLSGIFGGPRKARYNLNVGQDVLTDELLSTFRDIVQTPEAAEAYGAARDVFGAAQEDYRAFDREGAYSRAAVSSARRNLVRSGALSGGQSRGRMGLMEIGAAMNEATAGTLMAMEQARSSRMAAMQQAAGLLGQGADRLSISPFAMTALQSAYSMEESRMTTQAQLDMAYDARMMQMVGAAAGGGLTGLASAIDSPFLKGAMGVE